jgi:dipeptidyl-peptidase 4
MIATHRAGVRRTVGAAHAVLICLLAPTGLTAQDRLRGMPGYEQHARVAPQIAGSVVAGALAVTWALDGRSFE